MGLAGIYCDPDGTNGCALRTRASDWRAEAIDKALLLMQYAPRWIAIYYERDFQQAADHLEGGSCVEPANTDVIGMAAILSNGRWGSCVSRSGKTHEPRPSECGGAQPARPRVHVSRPPRKP